MGHTVDQWSRAINLIKVQIIFTTCVGIFMEIRRVFE